VSEVKQRVDLVASNVHSTIYIFIKMYVRAQRFFAVAFRMGGKVKGRAVALQNPVFYKERQSI